MLTKLVLTIEQTVVEQATVYALCDRYRSISGVMAGPI